MLKIKFQQHCVGDFFLRNSLIRCGNAAQKTTRMSRAKFPIDDGLSSVRSLGDEKEKL